MVKAATCVSVSAPTLVAVFDSLADAAQATASQKSPLIDVLARMERRGISIDRQVLSRLSGEFAQKQAGLEEEIKELAGEPLNPEVIEQVEKAERERREREALEWAAAEVVDDDLKGGDD